MYLSCFESKNLSVTVLNIKKPSTGRSKFNMNLKSSLFSYINFWLLTLVFASVPFVSFTKFAKIFAEFFYIKTVSFSETLTKPFSIIQL